MRTLSIAQLLAYRQCPKRLWLETHQPDLAAEKNPTDVFVDEARIREIAFHEFSPKERHHHDLGERESFPEESFHVSSTRDLTELPHRSVFGVALSTDGISAIADIMIPVFLEKTVSWRIIMVSPTTTVRRSDHDQVAIVSYCASQLGIPLDSIWLAYLDQSFQYHCEDVYDYFLKKLDLSEEAENLHEDVKEWIASARQIIEATTEPQMASGPHCHKPNTCAFCDYCMRNESIFGNPLSLLPGLGRSTIRAIQEMGIKDLVDVPDHLLTEMQQRVKHCTLTGETYLNRTAAIAEIAKRVPPTYFLSMDAISYAIPRWFFNTPYEPIPYQITLQIVHGDGRVERKSFIDLSGEDPATVCMDRLIRLTERYGLIFIYGSESDSQIIHKLFDRYLCYGRDPRILKSRIVELLPILRSHYYNPEQRGTWDKNDVIENLCPQIRFENLAIQNDHLARLAYDEAIGQTTTEDRRALLESRLTEYGNVNALALLEIWKNKFNLSTSPNLPLPP
jgi:hypothetical protein